MSINDSLDDLYKPAIRKTRGRVAKAEKNREIYSYRSRSEEKFRHLTTLNSYHKAWGVVRKTPEIMVKFGRCNLKSFPHILSAADYISRNGKLSLEDNEGNVYDTRSDYREVLKSWQLQKDIPDIDGRYGFARRIILSMPAGTDELKFEQACRQWAKDCLSENDYLITFHLPGNDKRTKNPHCHVLLSTIGKDRKRVHFSNEQRDIMREHFAACLTFLGVRANCTNRFVRGKNQKSLNQAEFHAAKRFKTQKERARFYAMDRKRKQRSVLTINMQRRADRVAMAINRHEEIPDHPAIVKAKETRKEILAKSKKIHDELLQSGNKTHQNLAKRMKEFYDNLPPVESREQKAVRTFKAQIIRRMQAMKKRKSEGR